MDWRTRRKYVLSGIMITATLIVIGILVYSIFIKHTPTCTDGIKNQNERGTDCGGICLRVCASDVVPLVTLWQRPVHVSGDVYSVIAYLENQNKNAGIKKLEYEIRLYDAKNILVGDVVRGNTFVGPNQKFAIQETGIVTGNRVPVTAFLKITSAVVWTRTDDEWNTASVAVSGETISDRDTYPKLSAILTNTHPTRDYGRFFVTALVYDTEGNIMGSSSTSADRLVHQETMPVFFTWQQPFDRPIGTVEIIPTLNPFNS